MGSLTLRKKARTELETNLRRGLHLVFIGVSHLLLASSTVSAAHTTIQCPIPPGLEPLFVFLHTLNQVVFIVGVSLGTLGFLVAGMLIASPIPDHTPTGRKVFRNVFVGVLVLLVARMMIVWMISSLGGTICTPV